MVSGAAAAAPTFYFARRGVSTNRSASCSAPRLSSRLRPTLPRRSSPPRPRRAACASRRGSPLRLRCALLCRTDGALFPAGEAPGLPAQLDALLVAPLFPGGPTRETSRSTPKRARGFSCETGPIPPRWAEGALGEHTLPYPRMMLAPRCRSPAVVLTAALVFIGIVIILHILGKLAK